MLPTKEIDKLTNSHKALIPNYLEKWRKQALSTGAIDIEPATAAIETVYSLIGLPKPKILFFTSPLAALEQFDLDNWGSQTVEA